MRYLVAFLVCALLAAPVLFVAGLALAPAPIAAEYWVRQALVVKQDIARQHRGERKGFVVGGSSALFSIDTSALSRELGIPVVNLATHVHLPLATQLENVLGAAERGDLAILALEPGYYCPSREDTWYVRNAIAWHPEAWRRSSLTDRAIGLWRAGPWLLVELAAARTAELIAPWTIRERLAALDDSATLRRFAQARPAGAFGYRLEDLDPLGNVRGTEGRRPLRQGGFSADAPVVLCAAARAELEAFARAASRNGLALRFANAPFMETAATSGGIAARARPFEADLQRIAPLLDVREQAVFRQDEFFDSGLHLNAQGRARRTAALASAIRADAALAAALGIAPI